uniref:FAD-binding PCMH-type domain-containing protein n=1 Tax=Paramoeba aestuarina TaxID=180227 RepID=A0A7S4NJF4_9EUKA
MWWTPQALTSLLPTHKKLFAYIPNSMFANVFLRGWCQRGMVRRMTTYSSAWEHVGRFEELLGNKGGVLTEEDDIQPFCKDWMGQYGGNKNVVLKPNSTEQVSSLLRYCSEQKIAVVPQGGNTGLVGGSVPLHNHEVILSLSRCNKIQSFDSTSGVVTCGSGVVLEDLDTYLADYGYRVPLDLGAKGTCQIGGNISTNAGGLRLLRYGSLHGTVLGAEVVTGDGRVLDMRNSMRKNNTGYGLHHMFIGAEGTLGVITNISLLATRRLASEQVMFLAVPSFVSAVSVLRQAKEELGEILSAFEFLDQKSLDLVLEFFPDYRYPLSINDNNDNFYVLIETQGSDEGHDIDKLMKFLEKAMESEETKVKDGTIAQSDVQRRDIWRLRESVTLALGKRGGVYKYDFSLPTAEMYDLVQEVDQKIKKSNLDDGTMVVGYGHMGDGNLHLNVSAPSRTPFLSDLLEPYLYQRTRDMGGSVSAEHGIGVMKKNYLGYNKEESVVRVMRELKGLMDPAGIMNPGKVL